MKGYVVDGSKSLVASVPDIKYNEMEFENFNAREVTVDGEEIGEYHLEFTSVTNKDGYRMLSEYLPESEVEILDPENILKLEYGISVITKQGSMESLVIVDSFDEIDERITKWKTSK